MYVLLKLLAFVWLHHSAYFDISIPLCYQIKDKHFWPYTKYNNIYFKLHATWMA